VVLGEKTLYGSQVDNTRTIYSSWQWAYQACQACRKGVSAGACGSRRDPPPRRHFAAMRDSEPRRAVQNANPRP
jgi:hypothetical protein